MNIYPINPDTWPPGVPFWVNIYCLSDGSYLAGYPWAGRRGAPADFGHQLVVRIRVTFKAGAAR